MLNMGEMKRKARALKKYHNKHQLSWLETIKKVRIYDDTTRLVSRMRVNNSGHGGFYYSLDDRAILLTKHNIIGNIPVDYSYILQNIDSLAKNKVIATYINRLGCGKQILKKPATLYEALQIIILVDTLLWQTGHTLVGLGRLDKVLDIFPFPNNGEQLIKDFLITIHNNYVFKSNSLIGDTGQIIILGGKEPDGSYFCNDYTYHFITILKELHIPDPKVLLRTSKGMPDDLLKVAVDCVSTGIGCPVFSNDDIVIQCLEDFGYDKEDAFNYGVSACWEPLSIGNSLEQNNLRNIEYGKCINETIIDDSFSSLQTFEQVYSLFLRKLKNNIDNICDQLTLMCWQQDDLLSLLMGLKRDISVGGAKYNNYGILSVGMSAAVDSLLNIKELAFDDAQYTLEEIKEVIETNYAILNGAFNNNKDAFGVNSESSVELTNRIIKDTIDMLRDYRNPFGGKVKFGLSSPNYIDLKGVGATLDGRKANQPFNTHISREKGEPVTELLNFASRLNYQGVNSNANVADIMLQSNIINDNKAKIVQLIKLSLEQGVFQIQINVLSYKQLIDAKEHPEKYPDLIVRVWGFSAYFNDLPEVYKDNLIRRAREMEKISF